MVGIVFGSEKLVIAPSQLDRTTDDGMWRFRFPYRHYEAEVMLAGNDYGPSPEWLDLAARVCAQVEKFVSEATNYLRSFMESSQNNCHGDWHLEWLEFGRDVHSELRWPFELVFVQDKDPYGGWGVLFANVGEPMGYWPRQFRRFER